MKTIIKTILLFLVFSCQVSSQQGFSFFHNRNEFLFASPGSMKYGLNGYDNPALLTYVEKFDLLFNWTNQNAKWNDLKNWGLFSAIPNFGFGLVHKKIGNLAITDYKLSVAFGSRTFSLGAGYGWSKGNEIEFGRTDILSLGALIRPSEYFSFGLVGTTSIKINSQEGYADFAFRPLGNELVTLFADYEIRDKKTEGIKKDNWSTGAVFELLSGLRLTGRYFDSKSFTIGINIGLGNFGISSQAAFDEKSKHAYNTYGIRIGGYDRNFFSTVFPKPKYLEMNLYGAIKYQQYKLFDNSNTLYSIVQQINAAKEDIGISGIAINTSGMNVNSEMLWEIRDRLKEFKSAGKKVVIFVDNPNLPIFHFATVADKIIMDPMGYINIIGYVAGRTFYKQALENIGIGIDEHRFFKYKSAVENFSRENMSEADKEQRQKLIDNNYKMVRNDICEGRNISKDEFDRLVNDTGVLLAQGANNNKLVDTLARWDAVEGVFKKLEKGNNGVTAFVENQNFPTDNHWGEPAKIAIIYALGVCDMDEGITARKLIKDVENVTSDPSVKAVVLRVDSPGGDGMASDYIAQAIKKCNRIKPVIVSQGSVAASGGYWLSMFGNTILAAPNTVTGSIGVISLWAYNKGLKEKIGFSTDYVKQGEHADLPFGMTLPFIGVTLPDRNLTVYERNLLESYIKSMYSEFVDFVADGRKLKPVYVDSIGQGRVWSGVDGLRNGLVDKIGGLSDAIKTAKEKAGMKEEDFVKIIQYPEMPLIDFGFLQPKLFGINLKEEEILKSLKFRLENIGKPLPILSFEEMDLIK
jgi:protease IV